MFVTCKELSKTLEFSVRFFKDGAWTVDESNDLLSDYTIYDGANISAEAFESLKVFLDTEWNNLQHGGRSESLLPIDSCKLLSATAYFQSVYLIQAHLLPC